MTIDKPALKALAEKATEGNWEVKPGSEFWTVSSNTRTVAEVNLPYKASAAQEQADAKYIAAANPAAILALLAEIEALTTDRDYCKRIAAHNKDVGESFQEECDRLKAEVESLRKDAERNNRMLVAACITIGEICEALGIDNHSEPDMIVEAVRELKGRIHD